jgi:uncharacterized protein (DUF2141 family)
MKTITTIIILLLTSVIGFSQNNVTVKINHLKTNNGTVMISLYDGNQKIVQQTTAKVDANTCEVIFSNLTAGTYAIQFYHDENDNGKMDTGSFGKPEEGYGYSNDARGFFGPADFEDQVFEVSKNITLTLNTVQ